jgi:hypothetical protein
LGRPGAGCIVAYSLRLEALPSAMLEPFNGSHRHFAREQERRVLIRGRAGKPEVWIARRRPLQIGF